MKPIRICCVPSHASVDRVSGVDFARIIQPMQELSKDKRFNIRIYDPKMDMTWDKVIIENDILFLNYTTNDWSFAMMGLLCRKYNRKIVLDIDDALWYVRPDNTAYEHFNSEDGKIYKIVSSICREVDYITTTNQYLKNVICNESKKDPSKVSIMPNYIDLSLYNKRYPPVERNPITITHFGSSSHFKDLQSEGFMGGLNKLMWDYPNVNFMTIGSLIPKIKAKWGQRYNHAFGHTDVYTWIKDKMPPLMEKTDIVVAPLDDDIYNNSKSYIKFLEYSSAMKPGVYQDVFPYREVVKHGENGFLATTTDQWYEYLKKLVDSVELRKKIADNAWETIQEHTMQKNVSKYADFFTQIMKS